MKKTLSALSAIVALAWASAVPSMSVHAADNTLQEAASLYRSGQYFKAARYAFAAGQDNPKVRAASYAWTTVSLVEAGLHQSAAYFFIRTLQTGDKNEIRSVLKKTETLLSRVGGDLLRPYLLRHTSPNDYDEQNRSAYLYALGKAALLKGQESKAIQALSSVSSRSPLWPFALQMRATARAIQGQTEASVQDFEECASDAGSWAGRFDSPSPDASASSRWKAEQERQYLDLRNRCQAGVARVYYQMNRFNEADRAWDEIPKASFVWTDILFEQAWNAFAKGEYNRTLGKLVTYKSPGLKFVFNSEVDVLRAQSYLLLCLYNDANLVINEFNRRYEGVGREVRAFVERNKNNLPAFYARGKQVLRAKLHTNDLFSRMMNRFIRGPYFQNLVSAERDVASELAAIDRFGSMQEGVSRSSERGFPGFLKQVLNWRRGSIALLGGAFVKNSLIDHHKVLIDDFEKMAFIKLEMLSRAKQRLLNPDQRTADRSRGNVEPSRRDDQYRWSFNGEFWADELGDYVFGLESECRS